MLKKSAPIPRESAAPTFTDAPIHQVGATFLSSGTDKPAISDDDVPVILSACPSAIEQTGRVGTSGTMIGNMSGDGSMDGFIRRANIEHYRRLLEQTTDDAERALILKLLAEEKAKTPPPVGKRA